MTEFDKYYKDLSFITKRTSNESVGLSPKATIIKTVCIYLFTTPSSEKYHTKTYWPLKIYFGIKDFETPNDDRTYWIYSNEKDLLAGYWFTEKEFNQYFRMVKIGHKD